jgi:acetolactate synthase-1/2/3 large subunit
VTDETVAVVAKAFRSGEPVALLLGGAAVRERGLRAAARITAETGAKVFGETFPTRLERGAGLPPLDRLAYLAEFATAQLSGTATGARRREPGVLLRLSDKASSLVPTTAVHFLRPGRMTRSARSSGSPKPSAPQTPSRCCETGRPGAPQARSPAAVRARWAHCSRRGLVADSPDRRVVGLETTAARLDTTGSRSPGSDRHGRRRSPPAPYYRPRPAGHQLEADGSACVPVALDPGSRRPRRRPYRFSSPYDPQPGAERVGVEAPGPKALSMLDLTNPNLDFVALAQGMGVDAVRPDDAEALTAALDRALEEPGPHLIEAVFPSGF